MSEIQFQTAYGEKVKPRTINNKPSRTEQNHAEGLDINNIMRRYKNEGLLPKMQSFEGVYGEFDSMDMREAIDKVEKANALFMEVPAVIRAQFDNDAGAFIDYATNPANIQQMADWGMANRPPEPPKDPRAHDPSPDDPAHPDHPDHPDNNK